MASLWRRRWCAIVLCIVCSAASFWSGGILIGNWDALWGDFYSAAAYLPLDEYNRQVEEAMLLILRRDRWDDELTYLEEQHLDNLEESLDAKNTNYRFEVRTREGELLWGNTTGLDTEDIRCQQSGEYVVSMGEDLWLEDEQGTSTSSVLTVYTGQGYLTFDAASDTEQGWTAYGYTYQYGEWLYDASQDQRIQSAHLVLQSGVTDPLAVTDLFVEARKDYQNVQGWFFPLASLFLLSFTAMAVLLRRLWRGSTADMAGWQERIPYDLFLLCAVILFQVLLAGADPIAYIGNQNGWNIHAVVGMGVLTCLGAGLALDVILSTAVRHKRGQLWSGALSVRLWHAVKAGALRFGQNWPVEKRMVRFFLLYLLGTAITASTVVLIPLYQGWVLWYLRRLVRGWAAISAATDAILSGQTDVHLEADKMPRALRDHARQLNDLGQAISNAVDDRLKSERFRTELITNVSHDLKTPLTSIINYVDLLKKTGVQDETALSYIEVLDRKSQRLKKLTEDLVEASKASSGTLKVTLTQLDFLQLLRQALGEYEEKFLQSSLTPVVSGPETPCTILADGRHLWRVVDNLLGNCCKYAMPGTRVYLDLEHLGDSIELTVKNISRAPLNLPPEQLLERFVRGDSSRTTEGSGLGLSIAQSLTELQGGAFRLEIDGDLFKARVALPVPPEPPSALPE